MSQYFKSDPVSIANFRESTKNGKMPGVSFATFKCRRCKTIKSMTQRRRAGSHIRDGYVCAECKEELTRQLKMNSGVLAED